MPISKSAEAGAIRPADEAPIVVTMGEPAGIGPELAVKIFAICAGRIGRRPIRLIGDPDVLKACGDIPDEALIPTAAKAVRTPGEPSPDNAPAVIEAIRTAVQMAMAGRAAAVVTAPIHKAVLMQAGFKFPGHTDYLAELTGAKRAVMMLAGESLRVVPFTAHIPLADVASHITADGLIETAEIMLAALARDFGIARPRLAVAALNPHAGEEGKIGCEETDIIAPAVARLKAAGATVFGPLPADTMFHEKARLTYDAALCMYHDQALIPLKTLSFWDGVNTTLGLPIVRTSPDHGTGFDIAIPK